MLYHSHLNSSCFVPLKIRVDIRQGVTWHDDGLSKQAFAAQDACAVEWQGRRGETGLLDVT